MNTMKPIIINVEIQSLWRTRDVSKYLNIPESTIRYWTHIKAIRFHKIGNLVRFIPQEIIEDFKKGVIGKPTYFFKKKDK